MTRATLLKCPITHSRICVRQTQFYVLPPDCFVHNQVISWQILHKLRRIIEMIFSMSYICISKHWWCFPAPQNQVLSQLSQSKSKSKVKSQKSKPKGLGLTLCSYRSPTNHPPDPTDNSNKGLGSCHAQFKVNLNKITKWHLGEPIA